MDYLKDMVDSAEERKLRETFAKQNRWRNTLYFAAESGLVDMYREMIQYYDLVMFELNQEIVLVHSMFE